MLKGISTEEIVEVTCKGDVDNPTVFLIGNLSQDEGIKLFTDCMDENNKPDMKKIDIRSVLVAGIKGIKNFEGADYIPDSEESKLVLKVVIKRIKAKQAMEIFAKIMSFNFPSEAEAKN